MEEKIYWKNGFYSPDVHTEIPSGAIEITAEQWQEFLEEQSKGKVIIEQSGAIVAVDPESLLSEEELARRGAKRQIASAKAYLAETDYVTNKLAEALAQGQDTTLLLAEYASVLIERQTTRDRINELEAMLK